ncbi:hypothetical protein GV791_04475 [Nocardia cyriacigeorgica]|uniref:Uncharacterized protein n=2 Tax=Nocardia cyriacigeorgica TaxID=135487 RepID=H6R1U5_NOCCG|nr:hypothetical protein [Nocardia cyriacigeorgica]MBF6287043.1 hypothetical protein [Nocardia cyriacigeorgica]MBF6425544.1 hypothetical protein [Nocardia cyriacigeorgica]NEW31817.1 hypothetical protein [Nocardia cyriacigeorgica]CCF61829.1 conserved protein of unknown function [Nocardia cyriacigeorgica GUH-2]BDT85248.1 hypothetical protein FMUAM8_10120 [Nocardia cyriacigeorgica]
MSEQQPAIPNVTVAASSNRSGTISVRATDQGMPVEIKFERSEYRYGAQALAAEILRLTQRSTVAAKARRREVLAESGMPDDILDRLGLPTRQQAVDELDRIDDADTGQTSWMRPV